MASKTTKLKTEKPINPNTKTNETAKDHKVKEIVESTLTKTKKVPVVDRDTNIAEIVFDYPKVAEVMLAYGLHCVGCFASHFDNIGQGSMIHGMANDEVDEMINEINLVLQGKEYSDD